LPRRVRRARAERLSHGVCASLRSTTAPTVSTSTAEPPATSPSRQAKIDCLTAWWETRLFSAAECAALEYAEALTRAVDTTVRQAFQRYHDSLALHFDETAMLEIVGVVVNMNVWTRLKLAQGAMPVVG